MKLLILQLAVLSEVPYKVLSEEHASEDQVQAEIYSWQLVLKPGIPPEDPEEDTSAITDYFDPIHQITGSVASLTIFPLTARFT